MTITVTLDAAGELVAHTAGYRGQDPSVVVPLLSLAATAAIHRLRAGHPTPTAAATTGRAAALQAVSDPAPEPEPELTPPAARAAAAAAEAAVASAAAVAAVAAPVDPVTAMESRRREALRMIDDGHLPELICDQLDISPGLLRRWARGDI